MNDRETLEKYPHLDPILADVIDGTDEERIRYLKRTLRNDVWIPYPVADNAVADFLALAGQVGDLRPECRFLVGPSNNGKSRILDCFMMLTKDLMSRRPDGAKIPVLMIQAPENPSVGGFFDEVLKGLDAPSVSGSSAKKRKDTALRLCRKVGLQMLVIDEFQHLASGTTTLRAQCLNAIKSMSTELGISIIVAGTEEAIPVITSLNQVENRLKPIKLDIWRRGEGFQDLMREFELVLPLRKESHLSDKNVSELILRQSEGRIGEIYFLLRDAAIKAIQSGGERITVPLLEELDYHGPSTRTANLRDFADSLRRKGA